MRPRRLRLAVPVTLSAVLVAGLLAFTAAPVAAGTADSMEASILRWINAYRSHPEPDKVPEMVRAASTLGSFGAFALAGPREVTRPAPRYSGLSRVPVDLTANLGFRLDTSLGGFNFSFANVLGFLPVPQDEGQ